MDIEISRLTAKYQATIPQNVRKALKLNKGDAVLFRMEGEKVVLDKAKAFDKEWAKLAQSTLTEWNSADDDETFRDL